MTKTSKLAALCGAAGLALFAICGTAAADGYEVAAPAAADEGRKFTYSFNLGATSDYVFRGVSQNDNDPTIQGGIDFGYGILYAGVWASGLNFERHPQRCWTHRSRLTGMAASSRPGVRLPSTSE